MLSLKYIQVNLGVVSIHYIAKFTILRFVISRFECDFWISVHCRKLEPIFNDLAVWYEQKGLNEREIVFVRIDVSDGNKPKDLNVSPFHDFFCIHIFFL